MKTLESQPSIVKISANPTLMGHVLIARADHWVKNVFVLPGIVVALSLEHGKWSSLNWVTLAIGFAAVCLIASSNYVINEVLDAPSDLKHPTEFRRPVPSGKVSIPLAYVEWIALMAAGMALSWRISTSFAATMLALWVMAAFTTSRRYVARTCLTWTCFRNRSTTLFACWQDGI